MSRVVIGMDPHKRSATDTAGYAAMLARVRPWPERVWAVEGCQGIGGHLASRLLADGEQVIGVPWARTTRGWSPQLHHLLLELIPGGAKKDLSAAQAKVLLAKVCPRDTAGRARRRVAAELGNFRWQLGRRHLPDPPAIGAHLQASQSGCSVAGDLTQPESDQHKVRP
jgi:transposase